VPTDLIGLLNRRKVEAAKSKREFMMLCWLCCIFSWLTLIAMFADPAIARALALIGNY
jgi:hypothetical protein